jgi:SecD/SecF fusion protein
LPERNIRDVDVLMVYDADFEVRGEDLSYPTAGRDESLRPCILFSTRGDGVYKMGHLTGNNIQRKLAIIFDNVLLSAPVIQSKISDNGQITGNFTQEEVDFMVGILRSGSMPVVMKKHPISENQIGSILGQDTIDQGSRSVVIALGLVLLFMAAYYRFSGLVACFALSLNLLMTVGLMVLLQAPFTLPGLAGLVLTVAMSVDANVLISERMREELQRGAALRMAIRNGFDKALSAIIDGNLTTFLTALVLYFIGTDQVKGFGMTLMLGNLTSMFTAIFVARVILEVGERTRWIKSLSMANFLPKPNVDWVRFLKPAVAGSMLLIVVGLIATVARGKGLFDIDLAGGTSVTFLLRNPTPEEQIRAKLDTAFEGMHDPVTNTRVDHNVYGMTVETQPPNTVYKVDSSLEDVELLKKTVRDALRQGSGEDGLRTFLMEIGPLTESKVEVTPPPPTISAPSIGKSGPAVVAPQGQEDRTKAEAKDKAEKPGEGAAEKAKTDQAAPADAEKPPPSEAAKEKVPTEEPKEKSDGAEKPQDGCGEQEAAADAKAAKQEQPPTEKTTDGPAATQPKTESPAPVEAAKQPETPPPPTSPAPTSASSPPVAVSSPAPAPKLQTKATVRFPGSPIGGEALRQRLAATAKTAISEEIEIDVDNPNWDHLDNSTFEEWTVTLHADQERAEKVLTQAKAELESEVVWQTSNKIGGQVSADTRWRALGALAVSLLGIVAYVWFRFQKVAWGLAAVAALAHDALVMLTGIALSYWLVGALGFAGVEEFKISLPVVAAFLTILGYSVNDTIVIFDRLREIRGKSPTITRQMLNEAVNQTLSRTIILAGITLTTVMILYFFGGAGIHAFAFALVIGVMSGLYTTLVIAAPMLLWLLNRKALEAPAAEAVEKREVPARGVPTA